MAKGFTSDITAETPPVSPPPAVEEGELAPTPPAPVEIPEYYAGFAQEFGQLGVELSTVYRNLQQAEQKLTQPAIIQMFPETGFLGFIRGVLKLGFLPYIAERFISEETRQAITREAQDEFDAASRQFQAMQWRMEIMQVLPIYLSDPTYSIENPEDILQYVTPGTELTDVDRAWLASTYGKLSHLTNVLPEDYTGDVLETQSNILNEILTAPKLELKGVHHLTVDEIAKSFAFGVAELPTGMTEEDVRNILSRMELTDEELVSQRDWLSDRAREWEVESARMQLIKAGTILAETPELTPGEWFKMIATQPMMATVELLQKWWDATSRPISAALMMYLPAEVAGIAHGAPIGAAGGAAIGAIIGAFGGPIGMGVGALIGLGVGAIGGAAWFSTFEDEASKELTKHYEFYREQGETSWSSYAKAFNEWDAPWWQKAILDSAYDPLMWIGWGGATAIGKKLATAALPRGLKWAGTRIGNLMVAFEQGYCTGADTVFKGAVHMVAAPIKSTFWLTGAGYTIPRTYTQMARNFARKGLMDFKAVLDRTFPHVRNLRGLTAKDVHDTAEAVIRSALDSPMEGNNLAVRAGANLLEFNYLDDVMAAKFVKDAAGDILFDTGRLARLNSQILDSFSAQGPRVTAGKILGDLGVEATEESITNLAGKIAKLKETVARKAIDAVKGDTADDMLMSIFNRLESTRYANLHSPLTKYMQQAGRSASWHSRVADKMLYSSALVALERRVVMPFARWQLLFFNFGPYNYLENMARSSLGGAEVMHPARYSGIAETNRLFKGLTNAPYELRMFERGQVRTAQAIIDPKTGATTVFKAGKVPFITRDVVIPDKVPFLGGKKVGTKITIGGKQFDIGSATDVYDMWAYLGSNQMAFDHQVHYLKALQEVDPKTMDAIADIIEVKTKHLLDDVSSISRVDATDIRRVLRQEATVSPGEVRFHADIDVLDFQRRQISMRLNKTFDKMTDIHSVTKVGIRDEVLDGTMFAKGTDSIDDRIAAHIASEREMNIASLSYQMDALKKEADAFIASPPRNIDDFLGDMQNISAHVGGVDERIHDFRRITELRKAKLLPADFDAFEVGSAKMLAEFMETSEEQLTKIMNQLMKNAKVVGLDEVQLARLVDLDSISRLELNNILATRTKIADIEAIIPRTPKRLRSERFWAQQRSQKAAIWDEYDVLSRRLKSMRLGASRNFLTSVDKPVYVPDFVPDVIGELTPNHLAYLYGVTGDDLYRGLTRVQRHVTVRPREDFIVHTKDQANAYAAKFGKTAEQIGFTDDAIGEVYDQMWKNLGIDPSILTPDHPTVLQLEEVRQELHRLYGSTKIPEADVIKWRKYINTVADDVENLPVYKAVAPPTVMGAGTVKSRITYPKGRRTTTVNVSDKGKVVASAEYYDVPDIKGIAIDMVYTKPDALRKGYATRALNEVLADAESRGLTLYSGEVTADGMKFFKGLESKGLITLEKSVEKGHTFVVRRAAAPALAAKVPGAELKAISTDIGEGFEILYKGKSVGTISYGTTEALGVKGGMMIGRVDIMESARRKGLATQAIDRVLSVSESRGLTLYSGMLEPDGVRLFNALEKRGLIRLTRAKQTMLGMTVTRGRAAIPPIAPVKPAVYGTSDWWAKKEQAMIKAREMHKLAYPTYDDANILDETMRAIFPFWNYELFRWRWIPRTYMRTPGTMSALARYMTYTDQGYIPVPATDLQINILRGTVWMGGLRSFYLRDFPEYHDVAPGIEFLDYIGRAGFFPGVHVMLPIVMFGAAGEAPQLGQLAPAWVKTGLSALRALSPEHIGNVLEIIYPDRFRDYLTMLTLGGMGYDADEIWKKKQQGIVLTEEEEKLWLQAVNKVDGVKGILMNQTGLFRIRPDEFTRLRREMRLAIEEATGVPVKTQEWIDKTYPVTGKRFSDYFHLDVQQQALLYQWESYRRYQGIITPLYPSSWQMLDIKISDYYNELEKVYNDSRYYGVYEDGELVRHSMVDINRQLVEGTIGPDQWRSLRSDMQGSLSEAVRILGESPAYKDVPKTFEERAALLEERGVVTPTKTPDQELLYYYYELKPELKYNWESDRMELDFDTYYAYIDILLESLSSAHRERLLQRIQNDWTPMEILYWEFSRTYARPYRNLRAVVLNEYSDEEVKLIRRFEVARGVEREQLLEAIGSDGGKLISGYQRRLRDARLRLRMLDSELDAWLYFFGTTDKLVTTESSEMYSDLRERYLTEAMVGEVK